jgi:PAS domain S-box-containing protein
MRDQIEAFPPDAEYSGVDTPQALLSAIVESSGDAIVSKTLEGIITSWNPAAESMFGYSAAEAVGRSIRLIIPDDRQDEEDYILTQVRRGEKIVHFETVRQTKDGRNLDISLTVSPIRDSAGRVVGASKIARDITENKRLQQQTEELLRREQSALKELAQALTARDEFIAVAAHELRNPLHIFRLTLELLRRIAGDRARYAQMPRVIERASAHLSRLTALVDRLLDVTRIRAGGFDLYLQPVDLGKLVSDVAARFSGEHVTLSVSLNVESSLHGLWDKLRLEQAVTNLISNAIKYGQGKPVAIRAYKADRQALVAVRDEGAGIPPEHLTRIFDQFERLSGNGNGEGWGLGLWITKRIVEAHGGTVQAESWIGRGSVFTIRLPLPPSS